MRTSSVNYRKQSHGGNGHHRGGSPGPERGRPALILVVDDHRTNRYLLQEVLKGQGYRVATAGNGAEALQKARQSPPDLIITDILMPVMDGFSLCWEWKRDERLKQIPLICYTGAYTDDQDRKFALELGAERFVVNTGNPEDLINVIREVLETCQRGGLAAVPPPVAEDTVFIKQHNEILARKLEDKVRQLEQAQRGRQRDVAERKRAEEVQARLASIVEHSDDAIIGRAVDGTITSWNAAAERILGYTAAEVVGRDPVEIFPPEARWQIAAIRDLVRTGQSVPRHEAVRITKDGRRIDVTSSVSPIRDNSGNIIGTATILHDISERKRIEHELQHKTELALLLEKLARAANEAVTPEAAMEICLRRICEEGKWALGRVTMFSPGLSQRKPDHSQWFCTEPARFDTFMRYSEGYEFKGEYSVFINRVLRDQCPVWLPDLTALDTAKLVRFAMAAEAGLKAAFAFPVIVRGEIAAFLEFFATETRPPDALLIDGTSSLASQFARMIERQRFEESRARLASIVEHSDDAIIGRAIDGTITSWNAAAERILGYTAAEVIGRELIEIRPPELRQEIAEQLKRLLAGQPGTNYETVRLAKDGRRIDVAISSSAVKDNNRRIIGTAAILHDITERKRAELILRNYAARLQTVSRKLLEVQEDERRRLARELHDQVGQVLTALKINLQVIGRQPTAAPVALKVEGCARIADAALQQLRTLMLDLRPPQLDELGLAVALRAHAERMMAPVKLALHFSVPAVLPKIPPAIEIVCFRIMQEALTNILRHAGARNVWIELAAAGDGLALTVRDDGKGFDLAEAHRRAMGGGSIGLLSMEERAALADGHIEISTAPGAGTTVRAMFSLPAAQSTGDMA